MPLYPEYQEKKYWQNRICRRKAEPEIKLVVTRVFHALSCKIPHRFECRKLGGQILNCGSIAYLELEFRVDGRWIDAVKVLRHRVQELEERMREAAQVSA